MMIEKTEKSKDFKLNKTYHYAYLRQSRKEQIVTNVYKQVFMLEPIGIGKIMSCFDRVKVIIGDLRESKSPQNQPPKEQEQSQNKTERLVLHRHPIMHFMLKKMVLYQSMDSRTRDMDKIISELKSSGIEISAQITEKVQESELIFKIRIQNSLKQSRVKGLKEYLSIVQELKQTCVQELLQKQQYLLQSLRLTNSLDPSSNQEQIKQNAFYLVSQVDKIEPLFLSQTNYLLSQFKKIHERYYEATDFIQTSGYFGHNDKTKVIPFPSNINSMVHSISDHVALRDPETDYSPQDQEMTKSLLKELWSYSKICSTKEETRHYYPLSPHTVIFDQKALVPCLLFEPLYLEGVGLSKKPMSFQNKVVYAPTPQGFDYFQSTLELNDDRDPANMRVQLSDPLYHTHAMKYPQYVRRHEENMEKIVVERFLLMAYYLRNGQQFGLPEDIPGSVYTLSDREGHFKEQWRLKKIELLEDVSALRDFIGPSSDQKMHSFHCQLAELNQYLNMQAPDPLLDTSKYSQIDEYFKLRARFTYSILNYVTNSTYFGRMYNLKKFIIMFLVTAGEICQEALALVVAQKKKDGERAQIRKANIIKLINKGKPYVETYRNSYKNVQNYQQRSHEDRQSKYLNIEETGRRVFQYCRIIYEEVHRVTELTLQMTLIEKQDRDSLENVKKYNQFMEEVESLAKKNIKLAGNLLKDLIYIELKGRGKAGPHKLNKENTSQFQYKAYDCLTRKVELLIYSYLSLQPENFITYQSIVMPVFESAEDERGHERAGTEVPQNASELNEAEQILDFIDSLINSSEIISRSENMLVSKANK